MSILTYPTILVVLTLKAFLGGASGIAYLREKNRHLPFSCDLTHSTHSGNHITYFKLDTTCLNY